MKTLIIIGGPTASGKTDLAILLAQHFNTQIISYDSRQFYREIPIVTAQPSSHQLSQVTHYCIGFRSISEPLNAAQFAQIADDYLSQVFRASDVCIAVGGSGLYVKAWVEGLDEIPAVPEEIRNSVESIWRSGGLTSLQKLLERLDFEYFKKVDLSNHRRLMRAIEVSIYTRIPYSQHFKNKQKSEKSYKVLYLGIKPERDILHQRIHARVDDLWRQGLYDEVSPLYPQRHLTPLQTVGCREVFDMIEGKITQSECIDQIKAHTRQYARRQITWYNRVPGIFWLRQIPKEKEIPFLVERLMSEPGSGSKKPSDDVIST